MAKITMWECPHTRSLFADEGDYLRHMARNRYAQKKQKAWEKLMDLQKIEINKSCYVNNAQELCEHVFNNQKAFIIQGLINEQYSLSEHSSLVRALEHGYKIDVPHMHTINMSANYRDQVSNTHYCPRDGETNFCSNRGKPQGYPGWQGKIETIFDEDAEIVIHTSGASVKRIPPPSMSRMASTFGNASALSGINTGSGSGGRHCRYELYLFADDFPNMNKLVKEQLFTIIKAGGSRPSPELDKLGQGFCSTRYERPIFRPW